MSKVVRAMPIRHGGCCSVEKFLFGRLAIFPNVFIEQSRNSYHDSLKYIRSKDRCCEQVERAAGKSSKSVQIFYSGGKIE